ncbi:MAG: hypothetical protein HKL82_10610 [Acidimicrobiaceae bacterium]|nr:hypothetical protein [Acidimicrobiaceae bacterium]
MADFDEVATAMGVFFGFGRMDRLSVGYEVAEIAEYRLAPGARGRDGQVR